MASNFGLLLCVLILGTTTFMQRLSADRMAPIVMQIVVGLGFLLYMPIAIHMSGGWHQIKWSGASIALTLTATAMSILGNVIFYTHLRGSNNTGAMTMLLCLYPVVTLALSALFLHETFTLFKVLGVVAMIIGTICLSLG
jgi:drug/metabolite transporter (DMT)-like permease